MQGRAHIVRHGAGGRGGEVGGGNRECRRASVLRCEGGGVSMGRPKGHAPLVMTSPAPRSMAGNCAGSMLLSVQSTCAGPATRGSTNASMGHEASTSNQPPRARAGSLPRTMASRALRQSESDVDSSTPSSSRGQSSRNNSAGAHARAQRYTHSRTCTRRAVRNGSREVWAFAFTSSRRQGRLTVASALVAHKHPRHHPVLVVTGQCAKAR